MRKPLNIGILLFIIPIVGIIIYLIFPENPEVKSQLSPAMILLHTIISTSGIWAGVLLIVRYLWRKYPWEKHPKKHLIIEIVLVLVYTNTFVLGLYKIQLLTNMVEPVDNILKDLAFTNLITLFITSIHEAIEFYQQWVANFSKSVKLEKANIEANYETLKSQINPHFLFNSLNSLTNIVHENNKAVDYIQDLSEFLRYILKSRDIELVLVRNEVEMLEKYLKLQKSRFGNNLIIDSNISETYFHYSVPPLVLQMLIENCLKHNIISKEKPLSIRLSIKNQSIEIENNLQKKINHNSTGQGLNNIIERYKFFTDREVVVKETSTIFKVQVPLLTVDL